MSFIPFTFQPGWGQHGGAFESLGVGGGEVGNTHWGQTGGLDIKGDGGMSVKIDDGGGGGGGTGGQSGA